MPEGAPVDSTWESYGRWDRLILLTALRYVAAATLTWVLIDLPAGDSRDAYARIVLAIIVYNTAGALLCQRVPLRKIALPLTALDFLATLAVAYASQIHQHGPRLQAVLNSLIPDILMLGVPALAVLYGRRAAILTLAGFAIFQIARSALPQLQFNEFLLRLYGSQLVFFVVLTYILGHSAEIEQAEQRRANALSAAERRARIELNTSNESKTRFLAFASHELRTPLHAILGFAALLLESPTLAPQQAEDARKIAKNGEYLLLLINEILDLTTLELGRLQLHLSECSPIDILEDALETLDSMLRLKPGLQLKRHFEADIPLIVSDEVRLKQVFVNLISNAIKFTESGEILLSARLEQAEIHISVQDSGPGIPSAMLNNLFEDYAPRSPAQLARRDGGGLGLAITKRLLELEGGRIEVCSELGQGTCFTVCLPRMRTHTPRARRIEELGFKMGPNSFQVKDTCTDEATDASKRL